MILRNSSLFKLANITNIRQFFRLLLLDQIKFAYHKPIFRGAFSFLYRLFYLLHHRIFLRPGQALAKSKLVVAGSCLKGGAGKTPLCAYLGKKWQGEGYSVALLCHKTAWDEVRWLQQNLSQVSIFSTVNRYKLAHELDGQFDIILCDDGFEDSRLIGVFKIRLDWGEHAETWHDLLPWGPCRSLKKDHLDISRTLHCGPAFQNPDIIFRIHTVENAQGQKPSGSITAICGLGDPERFFSDLEHYGFSLQKKITLRDHCRNFSSRVIKELATAESLIMSGKDAVRLSPELRNNPKIFVAEQNVELVTPGIIDVCV